jgi:hypothetical protein
MGNFKIDHKEIECEIVELAHDRALWQTPVIIILNL